ncbi:MAG TPA: adenylate kinase [Anaerohalosphaeraceae bacterium]|nr:adenylate kinase [Anaerohalosphaeraceae bacterium]HOL88302.1 adenylate kinase [Anaerohalosphaeraceae bacterium]HOQ03627.1 adenylate kinase [Anaerohalosphaeraceae bacterium]HPP56990.1 adenylate kinase [Anaerohalosphaeraceae bacterium]
MKLILLGPPGAGKGTQCKRITEKYGLAHLSSGDILRAERAAGTELGRKAQSYMDSGGLVPDDLIIDMMIGAIKKAGAKGYVLDGFPRTVVQAEGLDAALKKAGERIDAIVSLEVPDEAILDRMTGRRSCPKCGAVYHIVNLKPKVDGQCDKGCGPLMQRKDDSPEVVSNRLKTYHEQTAAVLGYYQRNRSRIIQINADQPIDEVSQAIFTALGRLGR